MKNRYPGELEESTDQAVSSSPSSSPSSFSSSSARVSTAAEASSSAIHLASIFLALVGARATNSHSQNAHTHTQRLCLFTQQTQPLLPSSNKALILNCTYLWTTETIFLGFRTIGSGFLLSASLEIADKGRIARSIEHVPNVTNNV